jgi:hypothetical protein
MPRIVTQLPRDEQVIFDRTAYVGTVHDFGFMALCGTNDDADHPEDALNDDEYARYGRVMQCAKLAIPEKRNRYDDDDYDLDEVL